MRKSPMNTKVSEEGEGGGAPGTETVIPLKPLEDPQQKIPTLQPIFQPIMEQTPGSNCSSWTEAHAGADFLVGTVDCEVPTLEQSVPKEHGEDPCRRRGTK